MKAPKRKRSRVLGSSGESSSQAEESLPVLVDALETVETTTLLREEAMILNIAADILRSEGVASAGVEVDEAAKTSSPAEKETTPAKGEVPKSSNNPRRIPRS